jgi:hypothetical protein
VVTVIRQSGVAASAPLTSVVRPSGNAAATMLYDGSTGDLAQITDTNGGVWHVDEPAVTGSYRVHSPAVLGASPADYYRFAENGELAVPINEVNGADAAYSGVTLGVAGGPFDDANTSVDDTTVAGFNGTSNYVALPSGDWPTTSPSSVSVWFRLPSGTAGVLYGYQTTPVTDSGATGWVPSLYVGTDGKLRGKFWNGNTTAITTAGAVNDNNWHHVVLAQCRVA